MKAKTTGAEFKRFYKDVTYWPNGAWHDDDVVLVDGVKLDGIEDSKIPDAAKVVIEYGIVFMGPLDDEGISLTAFFQRWKKAQETRTIVIDVHASKVDAVTAAVKAAGGKIL